MHTRAIAVDVDLGGGRRVRGEVFLHDAVAAHDGDENILDLMNDEASFFPLRVTTPTPSTVLVAKAHVQAMVVPPLSQSPRIVLERETSAQFDVTLELDDGVSVSGKVFVETPPGRQRPLDFFNAAKSGFFAVTQPDHDVLVNRARVHLVHDAASLSERPPHLT